MTVWMRQMTVWLQLIILILFKSFSLFISVILFLTGLISLWSSSSIEPFIFYFMDRLCSFSLFFKIFFSIVVYFFQWRNIIVISNFAFCYCYKTRSCLDLKKQKERKEKKKKNGSYHFEFSTQNEKLVAHAWAPRRTSVCDKLTKKKKKIH